MGIYKQAYLRKRAEDLPPPQKKPPTYQQYRDYQNDMLDPIKSEHIVKGYLAKFDPQSVAQAAALHNGGQKGLRYQRQGKLQGQPILPANTAIDRLKQYKAGLKSKYTDPTLWDKPLVPHINQFLTALGKQESNGDPLALGDFVDKVPQARGIFQIHKPYFQTGELVRRRLLQRIGYQPSNRVELKKDPVKYKVRSGDTLMGLYPYRINKELSPLDFQYQMMKRNGKNGQWRRMDDPKAFPKDQLRVGQKIDLVNNYKPNAGQV